MKKLEVENIRNCHHQKSGGIVDFFLGHNSVQNAAIFTFFCVQNVLGKMSWSEREHYCVVIGGSFTIPSLIHICGCVKGVLRKIYRGSIAGVYKGL